MLEHEVMLQLHQVCLFSHQLNLRGFLENQGQEQAGIEGISTQAPDQSRGKLNIQSELQGKQQDVCQIAGLC